MSLFKEKDGAINVATDILRALFKAATDKKEITT